MFSEVDEGEDSPLLIELLEGAEEATEPPPLPDVGLPKQWVPTWVRCTIKGISLPFALLDKGMQLVAKKIIRPPFKRKGKCLKRGNCCHTILVAYSKSLIGKFFYFWYTQIHGFYPRLKKIQYHRDKKVWVMGCRYLKKDGTCGQYRFRPSVCRQWPVIEHFGHPRILKGCGFYSEPSYPGIDEAPLPAEKDSPLKIIQ